MGRAKFSLNAFLLVVILFSATLFFVTVVLFDMRDYGFIYVDDYTQIGDSEYNARFSTREESGIYKGPYNDSVRIANGQFAATWGAAIIGEDLYITEYKMTSLKITVCDVTKIDLNSGEKGVVLNDAIIRGSCSSGEIVCITGIVAPGANPETNSLCKFYSLSSSDFRPEEAGGEVVYFDPESFEELYRIYSREVFHNKFENIYLNRTLDEIKKSA